MSRISPLFQGKKGPLPPASVLCWTPAVRKQYPLPAPTNSFLKMFFSLLFLPPSCYNVFSIFNPQPSKLPSSLQTLSDELSFKNPNLNAWLLQFAHHLSCRTRQSFAFIFFNWFLTVIFFLSCHISSINQLFSTDICQTVCARGFMSSMLCK